MASIWNLFTIVLLVNLLVVYTAAQQKGCPRLKFGGFGICIQQCNSNEDCGAGKICCSNGCGHICVKSIETDLTAKLQKSVCLLPKEVGHCRGAFPRYYYDTKCHCCEMFIYGGCGGNENNFKTKSDCKNRCPSPTQKKGR